MFGLGKFNSLSIEIASHWNITTYYGSRVVLRTILLTDLLRVYSLQNPLILNN
jgi:hypothetical protein